MTLPVERMRAVKALKEAAMLIFERGKKRPNLLRLRFAIRNALRHYPGDYDLRRIAECKRCRKIMGKEDD